MTVLANRWYFVLLILAVISSGIYYAFRQSSPDAISGIPKVVDYNFHIRPILSDRCFKCHGPDANQRKADLRLDTEAGLYAALKDDAESHVVVPGKPDHSELFLRISSADTSLQMPPPSSNLALTETEIKLIRKWIDQGAK